MVIDNEYNYFAWSTIRIIEGSDNRGPDKRGSTVYAIIVGDVSIPVRECIVSHIILPLFLVSLLPLLSLFFCVFCFNRQLHGCVDLCLY